MIINRYLIKEILNTFLVVILVVLLIAISHKVVRLVAMAASGHISSHILFQVILFQIPDLVAFLLPIGLFLAILLCYSRFFADNEIPVMLACGISWQRLTWIALSLATLVMLISATLTCYFNPRFSHYREQLMRQEGPQFLAQTINSGRFHSFHHDKLVLYVSNISAQKTHMNDIFIAEQPMSAQNEWSVIYAKTGQLIAPDEDTTYFELKNGIRYNGKPGQNNYSIVSFNQYQRLLEAPKTPANIYFHRTMPTQMLWNDPTPANMAELQWRLSIPFSAWILALFAVPLSQIRPREGRFSRLFVALLICIVYYNILTMAKRWVASDTLSPLLGLGWVHLVALLGALYMLMQTSGRKQALLKAIWTN